MSLSWSCLAAQRTIIKQYEQSGFESHCFRSLWLLLLSLHTFQGIVHHTYIYCFMLTAGNFATNYYYFAYQSIVFVTFVGVCPLTYDNMIKGVINEFYQTNLADCYRWKQVFRKCGYMFKYTSNLLWFSLSRDINFSHKMHPNRLHPREFMIHTSMLVLIIYMYIWVIHLILYQYTLAAH